MMNKVNFLEGIFGKSYYSSSTKEALFKCPFCNHHKRKLSINLETDKYQCWVCGKSGVSLYYIIREFGTRENVKTYQEKYKSEQVKQKYKKEDGDDYFKLSLPSGYIPLCDNKDFILGRRAYNYLINRGVSEEQILFYKIGIDISNEYFGRIVFPSFDKDGNLNFFITRSIDAPGYVAPKTPKGYRNTIVINELNIDWNKPVVIVEGFMDAIKSGITNVIPLSGSNLSKRSLLYSNIVIHNTIVILALDADAEEKSNRIANNFLNYDIDVKFLNVRPFNDVGEMNADDFADRYEHAIYLDKDFLLRQKFRSIV